MHQRTFCSLGLLLLTCCLGCGQQSDYRFSQTQRQAVTRLLADSVAWRLALDSDNTNPNLTEQKREHPDYRPYFLEADFDNDGRADFVIALVHKTDSSFAGYLFRGIEHGYSLPQLVFRSDYLKRCGLFFKSGELLIGEFYSDNVSVFRWDQSQRKMVSVVVEEDER